MTTHSHNLPTAFGYLRDEGDERTLRKAAKALAKACFNAHEYSKDRSTKVAAVFYTPGDWSVLSEGYNGFPRGARDDVDERHERPAKYLWSSHAERNGIDNAARMGTCIDGAIAVVTAFPCAGCMGSLINAGISRVITVEATPDLVSRWGDSFEVSQQMVREAHAHRGFAVRYLSAEDLAMAGVSDLGVELVRRVAGIA